MTSWACPHRPGKGILHRSCGGTKDTRRRGCSPAPPCRPRPAGPPEASPLDLMRLRSRDAGQETKQQGGIRGVVIVHEAMTGTGIDLHVARYFELGKYPVEPLAGTLAGLSASPVITSQVPTTRNVSVISHRLTAPTAASVLTVSVTGSKDDGCKAAAIVHPPTSSTGAAAEESTPTTARSA